MTWRRLALPENSWRHEKRPKEDVQTMTCGNIPREWRRCFILPCFTFESSTLSLTMIFVLFSTTRLKYQALYVCQTGPDGRIYVGISSFHLAIA